MIVTGSGDSLCAAELVARLYPETGATALGALDASAAALDLGAEDALIAISVSGRTPRVVETASRARRRGATIIAVTDDPGSALAEHGDDVWHIGAAPAQALQQADYDDAEAAQYVGYHHDVAQTKSFFAVLLTIARAAEATGSSADTDWPGLANRIDVLCQKPFWGPLHERALQWAKAGQTFFLASGAALPIARFGAYKMFEFDRSAHFTEIEEYCHTHYFITRRGDSVVLVLQTEDDAQRAAEIAPVLAELFEACIVVIRPDDVTLPNPITCDDVIVPGSGSALERALGLLLAVEWVTYLCGRVGAPDIDTFHAGHDTARLISASMRTIRRSVIRDQ